MAAFNYLADVVLSVVVGAMVDDDIADELASPELIALELASGAAIGAGVTTGAGAGGGVSSFFPQAVRQIAKSEATSRDLFIISSLLSSRWVVA